MEKTIASNTPALQYSLLLTPMLIDNQEVLENG